MSRAARPPTRREAIASARSKLEQYHDDVRAGERARYRTPTRGEVEAAAERAGEGADGDGA